MLENMDRVIAFLRRYNQQALNPLNLIERIKKATGVSLVEIHICMKELLKQGYVSSAAWDARGIPLAKLYVNLPPEPLKDYEFRWQEALAQSGLDDNSVRILMPAAKYLEGMGPGEMARLVRGLRQMREDAVTLAGKRLYNVSARYLLGSSKLLRYLPTRILREFGIPIDSMLGPQRVVRVAASTAPRAVILIENPHAFESAVLADDQNEFCFISSDGNGLSKQGEEYGDQLVELADPRSDVYTLSWRNIVVDFNTAIKQCPHAMYFWGDLDLAGMNIYARLKRARPEFADMQLSPLYDPMIEQFKAGGWHSYKGVQKDGQKLDSNISDALLDEIKDLAELCKERGVDQETVIVTKELLYAHYCIG